MQRRSHNHHFHAHINDKASTTSVHTEKFLNILSSLTIWSFRSSTSPALSQWCSHCCAFASACETVGQSGHDGVHGQRQLGAGTSWDLVCRRSQRHRVLMVFGVCCGVAAHAGLGGEAEGGHRSFGAILIGKRSVATIAVVDRKHGRLGCVSAQPPCFLVQRARQTNLAAAYMNMEPGLQTRMRVIHTTA